MIRPKVVLDTNVYLSAIIFGGKPRKILSLGIQGKILFFTSSAILLEIADKLKDKFLWSNKKINETIKTIADTAKVVRPESKVDVVKDDPSDNKIIEAGIECGADFIISGDKHLLKIKKYENIKILGPSDFLKKFEN